MNATVSKDQLKATFVVLIALAAILTGLSTLVVNLVLVTTI